MDKLTFSTGGFPLSVDRLRAMQECWQTQYNELMKGLLGYTTQDYVVSGCGTLGDADGWIVLQGELLEHRRSGLANGNGQYVYVMEEVVENVTYEDGVARPFRVRRYATSGMYVPNNAIYSTDWDDVEDNTGALRTLAALSQSAVRQTDLNTVRSQISALQTQIATLNAAISAIDTSTDTDLGSISDRIATLQRNLVPKGTIIMTAQALPLSATTTAEVISGMGNAYGYIPCYAASKSKEVCQAWNGYFDALGLPAEARWPANQAYLNFPWIAEKIGLTCPNMSGRFPLGVSSDYLLGKQGGEATHKLTVDEMPAHSHRLSNNSSLHAWLFDCGTEEIKDSGSGARGLINGSVTEAFITSTLTNGSDQAHNNMPPYYPLNFLIKVI